MLGRDEERRKMMGGKRREEMKVRVCIPHRNGMR
jgi:hypothetical protein